MDVLMSHYKKNLFSKIFIFRIVTKNIIFIILDIATYKFFRFHHCSINKNIPKNVFQGSLKRVFMMQLNIKFSKKNNLQTCVSLQLISIKFQHILQIA